MTMKKKTKVLVVAAHPDDEVLGCGATIAKHTNSGDTVWVLIIGEGIASRKDLKDKDKTKQLRKLKVAARRADKFLGVDKLILKSLPDNRLDTVPLLKIVHIIEDSVRLLKPEIIYTHHSSDINIDHKIVSEAVAAIIRPVNSTINLALSFEIPSSTEWNFQKKNFSPNVFVSMGKKSLGKKLTALREYKSEIREFPHPRSEKYLKALATVRGSQSGNMLAEAFELILWRI